MKLELSIFVFATILLALSYLFWTPLAILVPAFAFLPLVLQFFRHRRERREEE